MAFETQGKVDSTAIQPVALGLISDPPTIVLTYDFISATSVSKRRKRKMPLRDFTDKSNVKRYAFNLRQRHNKYLTDVIDVTLEKMLRIIQEIQKGNSVGKSLELVNKEYFIDPKEDLNTLSPAQLAQRKAVMEETFRKNLIKPGDPGYVYDKVINFEEGTSEAVNNEWDEDEGTGDRVNKSVPIDDGESGDHTVKKDMLDHGRNDEVFNLTQLHEADEAPLNTDPDKENQKMLADTKAHSSLEQEEGEMQVQKTDPETDESSSNNIEEALEIETGGLDEDDEEDFWQ